MCLTAPPLQICSDLVCRVFLPRLTNTAMVQLDTAKVVGMQARKRVDSSRDKRTAIYAAPVEARSLQFT